MLKPNFSSGIVEAGCDEAGRGCLAGPVVAAAVILNPGFNHNLLNDSKKLSKLQRKEAREIVVENALSYAVGMVEAEEIDRLNILKASFIAMHRALEQLNPQPEFILVDGNRFIPYRSVKHCCIVKGDSLFSSIAAASILAKMARDELMINLHNQYPDYHWNENKGYPTAAHREAIGEKGITPFHRKSFRLLSEQMKLDFS